MRQLSKMSNTLSVGILFGGLCVAVQYAVNAAPANCGPDKFWMDDTETCEPCANLCLPPGASPNDCRERCFDYRPTAAPSEGSHHPLEIWHIVLIVVGSILLMMLIFSIIIYRLHKIYRYHWVERLKSCFRRSDNIGVQETDHDTNSALLTTGGTRPISLDEFEDERV